MQLFIVLHDQLAAPPVGDADADARVFHRAGKSHGLSGGDGGVIFRLYRLQRFGKTRFRADDLPVRQHAAGADGVTPADLPRRNADLVRHFVQQALHGKARLRHAEAAERARGRVIGIVGSAFNFKIFVGIRTCRVRARALQNRAAERRERAGVGVDGRLHTLNDAVFVTAERKIHPERVALGVHEQRLRAAELHFNGQPRDVCNERRMVLHRHILLAAEAAADELVFHLHLVAAEQQRAFMQRRVRGLVGREEHHVAVLVLVRHTALRL